MTWRRGDKVRLIGETGEEITAMVLLVSENQVSLAVGFSGILDGHVNGIPLLRDAHGDYRSIISNSVVEIRRFT